MTTFSAASKPGGSTSVFDVGAKLTDVKDLGDRLDKATEFVREKVFKQKGGKQSEGSGPFGGPFQAADMMKKGRRPSVSSRRRTSGVPVEDVRRIRHRDRDHRVIDHGLVYIRQV